MLNSTDTMKRLRAGFTRRVSSRKALALLDVLIGMAIFALIAVIAVVAFSSFRQRAFETGTTSDANALGQAIEGQTTGGGNYPTALTGSSATPSVVSVSAPATGFDLAQTLTKNDVLKGYKYVAPTASAPASFNFCIEHQSNGTGDAAALYDSAKGGIVWSSHSTGCSGAPTGYTYP